MSVKERQQEAASERKADYRLAVIDHHTGQLYPVDVWLSARQALSGEYTPRFGLAMLAPGHTDNPGR